QSRTDIPLGFILVKSLEFFRTLVTQHQARQIALRVRIDQDDAMPLARQHPTQIKGGGGLADTPLMVEEGDPLASNGVGLPMCRLGSLRGCCHLSTYLRQGRLDLDQARSA